MWIALWLGCQADKESTPDYDPEFYIDARQQFPAPPDGGIQIESPPFEVPPYSEVIYCYFGQYDGPTVGIDYMEVFQADAFSHHNQLKVSNSDFVDGELVDCNYLADGSEMADFVPLFEAAGIEAYEGMSGNWLNLPDGIAMKLRQNQKWVLEMHYVNSTGKTLIANNAVNLGVLPKQELEFYAGSAQFDAGPPAIEPGFHEDVFDCEWPYDVTVLSLSGHMHSTGLRFWVEHVQKDGTTTEIYRVEEWDGGVHPYFPVITNLDVGELEVEEGDIFRTYCEWDNPTDQVLGFPAEMCTTAVVSYPMDKPLSCIDGVFMEIE